MSSEVGSIQIEITPLDALKAVAAHAPAEAGKTSAAKPAMPPAAGARNGTHNKPSTTPDRSKKLPRAKAYALKIKPAISGQHGHDTLYGAVCRVMLGFDLSEDETFEVIKGAYNPLCQPEWSDADLWHKIHDAAKESGERGHLLRDQPNNKPTQTNGQSAAPRSQSYDLQDYDKPVNTAESQEEDNKTDWSARIAVYQKALEEKHILWLMQDRFKLPANTLGLFQTGYMANDGFGTPCFPFLETDENGNGVGIAWVYGDGKELAERGSKRGVTIPKGLKEKFIPGTPLVITHNFKDLLGVAATGLPVMNVPCGGQALQSAAAVVRSLSEAGSIVVLGRYDVDRNGDWPGRDLAQTTAAGLKETLGEHWGVKWTLPPAGYSQFLEWIAARGPDRTSSDAWSEFGSKVVSVVDEKLLDPPVNAKAGGYSFNVIDSATFAATNYKLEWLIRSLLVRGQPIVFGGPRKSLKTSLVVALVIALGSGLPFLGCEDFRVYRRVRTAILSGESGEAVIKETCERICKFHGIELATLDVFWGFDLPQLANPDHLNILADGLRKHKIEVLIIDPLYLALLAGLDAKDIEAGNLFKMGPLLLAVAKTCLSVGCTPILIHHSRKNLQAPFEPLELEDLAFSGIQEFARQWILLNRREKYKPGTGLHELWMSVGGSAGQGGQWAVNINEGVLNENFGGRTWVVSIDGATEARQSASERKQNAKAKEEDAKVLTALDKLSKSELEAIVGFRSVRDRASLSDQTMRRIVARLVDSGVIEEVDIDNAGKPGPKTIKGLRRVQSNA